MEPERKMVDQTVISWNRVMHWLLVVSMLARTDPYRLHVARTPGYQSV